MYSIARTTVKCWRVAETVASRGRNDYAYRRDGIAEADPECLFIATERNRLARDGWQSLSLPRHWALLGFLPRGDELPAAGTRRGGARRGRLLRP